MSAAVTSLWPDDIKVDVLPPLAILRYQAAKLSKLTEGILEADVVTTTGHEDFAVHRLDLVAAKLDGRAYRILTATHRAAFYPVVMEADCFRPKDSYPVGRSAAGSGHVADVPDMTILRPERSDPSRPRRK